MVEVIIDTINQNNEVLKQILSTVKLSDDRIHHIESQIKVNNNLLKLIK